MVNYEPLVNTDLKGNVLKDFIQEDITNKKDNNLLAECYTGFGKTRIGIKRIKYYAKNNINLIVDIVVPKEHLLKSWLEDCKDLYIEFPFIQINMYVINSYTMQNKSKSCDLLIIDEVHRALNDASEFFSTAITKYPFKYSLFLTATLKPSYEQYLLEQLQELNKQLAKYTVSLYWGWKNGLVQDTKIYNVPVQLSLREKAAYMQANDTIKKYQSYFAQFSCYAPYDLIKPNSKNSRIRIAKILNQTEGQVFGTLMKWQKAINDRKVIIHNCATKYSVTLELLEVIKEKILIFCGSIDFSNLIELADPYAIAYHSKLKVKEKKEVLDAFYSNKKPHLISINALKEGFNIIGCRLAIRVTYNSNELDLIQQIGRIIRFDENNPNAQPVMINFYVDDFIIGNTIVESQEKKWLYNSLNNQQYENIELEDLKQILV